MIGGGGNMSDFTYVENAAHANICAEEALCSNAASVAGKVHFLEIKGLCICNISFMVNSGAPNFYSPFLLPMMNLWKLGSL